MLEWTEKLANELLEPNSFFCSIDYYNILSLCGREGDEFMFLETLFLGHPTICI
jgi:hypothetical protein